MPYQTHFLSICTYILSLLCVCFFFAVIFCFVSVNVTSVNILINNITAFEEKIDYWLLFISKEPKVHLLSLVSQYFFIESARGSLIAPNEFAAPKL